VIVEEVLNEATLFMASDKSQKTTQDDFKQDSTKTKRESPAHSLHLMTHILEGLLGHGEGLFSH